MVTVCGGDGQACPFFPGGKTYLHESFEDPAEVDDTDQDKNDTFRRTRDEIKVWIENTLKYELYGNVKNSDSYRRP